MTPVQNDQLSVRVTLRMPPATAVEIGYSSWRRLTGLAGRVIGGGQEPTGQGLIGAGNQHANALNL